MKTILPEHITTVDEAKKLLTDLYNNCESFHPEDDAHDIIWNIPDNQIPTFDECEKLNSLMDDTYNLNGNNGNHRNPSFDPCEFILELGYGNLKIEISDIIPNAKFKTATGIIWIIDKIENDRVETSMEHGKKGNYKDDIQTVVDFLNEEKSIKIS